VERGWGVNSSENARHCSVLYMCKYFVVSAFSNFVVAELARFCGSQEGGFESLALTVDATWYGNRERDIRQKFTIPPAYTAQQATNHFRRTWDKNNILRFLSMSLVSRDVLLQSFHGLVTRSLSLIIAFLSPLKTGRQCS
jgi:hypothetical protein